MGITQWDKIVINPNTEQNLFANIDHMYNNAGRAYQRNKIVQAFGEQQLNNINHQFGSASSKMNQGIARRGLFGGSAALSAKAGMARRLQDARADVSGRMQALARSLASQDESARRGLHDQFSSALAANTANQNTLTGLAGQLNNQAHNLNLDMLNGVMGAGVGAYNIHRQQQAINDANAAYQPVTYFGGQSRNPSPYSW